MNGLGRKRKDRKGQGKGGGSSNVKITKFITLSLF